MANVVKGKIYLTGAIDPDSLNQVYDPATDSWTNKTSPPHQIWSTASAVVDDKIYFIDINGNVLAYDTTNDSWSTGATAPMDAMTATAGVTSGANAPKRIYFLDETGNYVYDPANDSWSTGAAMPTPRGFAGIAVINDTLYAVGGIIITSHGMGDMRPSPANEQYTPIGYGTVSPPPSLSPTPSPTSTPTPSPSETPTPSTFPSPSASGQPTSSPNPQQTPFPTELVYVAAGAAAIVAVAAVAVALRRRK